MPPIEFSLINAATKYWPERIRSYKKGNILYWQGDPVENLFVIRQGAVKISSLSGAGKINSHGILGAGHLLGATDYFLDGVHETTAEVIDATVLVVVPLSDFQHLIARDLEFSSIVMHELAREAQVHFSRANELSFLDAQQRLKHSLIKLADEHGLKTEKGIEISVSLTHEELAELINANRTTITLCLQELKKLGYLRTEGRRIILLPAGQINILDQLSETVASGAIGETADWAEAAIREGVDPAIALNALTSGMKEVDRKYTQGQMDITDIMWASARMKEAMPVLEKAVQQQAINLHHLGRIIFGTVQGDIHSIGKTIVSMLLRARGFDVIDLGEDIPAGQFVDAVRQYQPHILAMSALLTTTQIEMKNVIGALTQAGLRDDIKVMIGGAPTTPKFAQEIGADGYAHEARGGVELAWGWCSHPDERSSLITL